MKPRVYLAGGSLAVAGLLLFTPAPSGARSRPLRKISLGSQSLLYTSLTSGQNLLHEVQGDGTEDHPLPDPPIPESELGAWSRDGRRIAFHTADAQGGLWVMNADGSAAHRLPASEPNDSGPTWSPDGTRIAFARTLGPNVVNTFVMDAAGRSARNLTNSTDFDADPAWSPNGEEILFTSTHGGQGFRLFTIHPNGGKLRQLPAKQTPNGMVFPAWSVDGKQIAFTEGVGDGIELFACDRKGLRRHALTALGGFNFFPAWAPDGKHIAFEHYDDADHHGGVWIMDTDGGNPHAVVPDMGGFYTGRPAWRPIRGQARLATP